jgi:hypothetical protein
MKFPFTIGDAHLESALVTRDTGHDVASLRRFIPETDPGLEPGSYLSDEQWQALIDAVDAAGNPATFDTSVAVYPVGFYHHDAAGERKHFASTVYYFEDEATAAKYAAAYNAMVSGGGHPSSAEAWPPQTFSVRQIASFRKVTESILMGEVTFYTI